MSEGTEVNPLANIQKTARAQQERVRGLKTGFEDDLKGKETSGKVIAKYERGRGGWVETSINSGQAILKQTWQFDGEGKLSSVKILKMLSDPMMHHVRERGSMLISRGGDGKLQVMDFEVSPDGPRWEEEFAKGRKGTSQQTESPKTEKFS